MESLERNLEAARCLLRWFKDAGFEGVVIGGVAVSLVGRGRATKNVDAMILMKEDLPEGFMQVAAAHGFHPRIDNCLEFAMRHRVFLLHHRETRIDTDVSLGVMPFEVETISRALWKEVGTGVRLPVPTPEDLIIMKCTANRPHDWVDIQGVIDSNPGLEWRRIMRWTKQYAEILERPEVVTRLESMRPRRKRAVARRPSKGKSK